MPENSDILHDRYPGVVDKATSGRYLEKCSEAVYPVKRGLPTEC